LSYWEGTTIPETNGSNWSEPPFSDLTDGRIFSIKSRYGPDYQTGENLEEIWVASANGLFQYAFSRYFAGNDEEGEYFRFRYGTTIKKQVFRGSSWFDEMDPEFWYIEGQERLYGSEPTYPTALFVDPFQRVWIGTNDNGITLFDVETDTFTIFNKDNSPLIADRIKALNYDKYTGKLYIGTDIGLQSVEIGIGKDYNFEEEIKSVKVYPNPFYPAQDQDIKFLNDPSNTMPAGETRCHIYDLHGDLVIILDKNIFELFSWDGKNSQGKLCGTGLYIYVITAPSGELARGKFSLIN
jgi:hypothetical protein